MNPPIPALTPALLADADGDAPLPAEARRRLAGAAVIGAARGRIHGPHHAPKYIDLDSIDVGQHGETDPHQTAAIVDDLIQSRPYLAAPAEVVTFTSPGAHRPPTTHRPVRPIYQGHYDRGTQPDPNRF